MYDKICNDKNHFHYVLFSFAPLHFCIHFLRLRFFHLLFLILHFHLVSPCSRFNVPLRNELSSLSTFSLWHSVELSNAWDCCLVRQFLYQFFFALSLVRSLAAFLALVDEIITSFLSQNNDNFHSEVEFFDVILFSLVFPSLNRYLVSLLFILKFMNHFNGIALFACYLFRSMIFCEKRKNRN